MEDIWRNTKIWMQIKYTIDGIFKVEQCTFFPCIKLNNPCDSIKAIYPTQETLHLRDILFSVFFAKI